MRCRFCNQEIDDGQHFRCSTIKRHKMTDDVKDTPVEEVPVNDEIEATDDESTDTEDESVEVDDETEEKK